MEGLESCLEGSPTLINVIMILNHNDGDDDDDDDGDDDDLSSSCWFAPLRRQSSCSSEPACR